MIREQVLLEYDEEGGDYMVYNLGQIYNSCVVQCRPNKQRLFFIGGQYFNSQLPTNKVLEANLDATSSDYQVVVERQPLPKPRTQHSAVCIRNFILVVGGSQNE